MTVACALQCLKQPVPILVGYLAQYIVKPVLGFAIARVSLLPKHPASGNSFAQILEH